MAENGATEVISAIAGLWRLGAAIAVPISLYLLRKPLAAIVPRLKRFKRGETEIELQEKPEVVTAEATPAIRATAPEEETAIPEPRPSEDRPFQMKLFKALMDRNSDLAERLFQEQVQKEPDKKLEHELFYTELRCDFLKDADAVTRLERFKSDRQYEDKLDGILHTLGRYYEVTEQYAQALEQFRAAEKSARKSRDKAYAVTAQARVLSASGDPNEGLSLLIGSLAQFADQEALARIYEGLAETHRILGNKLERAVALEKVAQLNATEKDALFNAAYAQSACDLPYLSLHNYIRELTLDPTQSMARNNYAVQLAELGLPMESVEHYRRAQADGNTLAMANIAHLYMQKGFADDAERLLQQAQKAEKYHGNVDRALVKLRGDRMQEDEKLEGLKKWGSVYQTFVRSFAEALLLPLNKRVALAGEWRCSDGEACCVTQTGDEFSAEWGKQWSRRKLDGHQTNRAGKGEFFVERSGLFAVSDKPTYSEPKHVLFFVSEDGTTFDMLSLGKDEPVHLSFVRTTRERAEQ